MAPEDREASVEAKEAPRSLVIFTGRGTCLAGKTGHRPARMEDGIKTQGMGRALLTMLNGADIIGVKVGPLCLSHARKIKDPLRSHPL